MGSYTFNSEFLYLCTHARFCHMYRTIRAKPKFQYLSHGVLIPLHTRHTQSSKTHRRASLYNLARHRGRKPASESRRLSDHVPAEPLLAAEPTLVERNGETDLRLEVVAACFYISKHISSVGPGPMHRTSEAVAPEHIRGSVGRACNPSADIP